MLGVRDPVYEWIRFSKSEKAVIDCKFVQRLRFVSQLTSVEHVFPGGTHNRFAHSLGAMKLAGKYMKHLIRGLEDTSTQSISIRQNAEHWIRLARMAALLHDVGHGPFSHAYDEAVFSQFQSNHDMHRHAIIRSEELQDALMSCGISPDHISACWDTTQTKTMHSVIRAIIEGPLGADRMDFVLRDSYFTGTTHLGTISYKRIIQNSRLVCDTTGVCLAYAYKALPDIIQALINRVHMYDCVYLHKTSTASSLLIDRMLRACAEPLRLLQRTHDLQQYVNLTDYSILGELMSSEDPALQLARQYCEAYMFRHLPKLVHEQKLSGDDLDARYDLPESETVLTKIISGLDHTVFDEYHIVFVEGTRQLSAKKALKRTGYTSPFQKYRYIRHYSMPFKNSNNFGSVPLTKSEVTENVNHPAAY